MSHRSISIALAFASVLALGGCGDSREANAAPVTIPADGTVYTTGGGMSLFYGEMYHDGRFYVYGDKKSFNEFLATKSANPTTTKSFIGQGPDRKTLVVQADKDQPQMTTRLVEQIRSRYGLNNS